MSERHPEDHPQPSEAAAPDKPAQPSSPQGQPAGSGPLRQTDELTNAVVCPKCGHRNRPGTVVCDNCQSPLLGADRGMGTKQFERLNRDNQQVTGETGELINAAVVTAGSNIFTDDMVLRLEIEGAATPILLFPKKETVIGRRDPATGTMPDVDLTSYAGYRMGVSRRHAVIRLRNNEVEIFDLGSSNGTGVNGTRLQPHQPQPLRDGDEISLGKMNLRVLFQLRTRRRSMS